MEVEDGHMLELAVKLPASMPLRAPDLECRRKVGGWQRHPQQLLHQLQPQLQCGSHAALLCSV